MVKTPRDRLALACDLPLVEAVALYRRVQPHVGVAKVGLSLFVEHGPAAVRPFQELGAKVFLDLKLHDIPNTVELAAAKAKALGVAYLTIHAGGGLAMMEAAMRGAGAGPMVLAVTVLTSFDGPALKATGVETEPVEQVARLAALAKRAGVGGLVCSAREVAQVRGVVGPGLTLVTPGIRPLGSAANDQARVETPQAAIAAGSDLLVVGRPITEASDPVVAAQAIAAEIAAEIAAAG